MWKAYDSDAHYRRWSAHSASEYCRAFPDANPRASVESRYYVHYE